MEPRWLKFGPRSQGKPYKLAMQVLPVGKVEPRTILFKAILITRFGEWLECVSVTETSLKRCIGSIRQAFLNLAIFESHAKVATRLEKTYPLCNYTLRAAEVKAPMSKDAGCVRTGIDGSTDFIRKPRALENLN